jgi:LacI family transcriptional regulator
MYNQRKSPLRRIGLLIARNSSHFWALLKGIYDYASEVGDWQCIPIDPDPRVLRLLRANSVDGILGTFFHRDLALSVKRLRKPTVELSDSYDKLVFPRVVSNNYAIGQKAAEYFLSLGFRSFGFVGPMHILASCERFAGFKNANQMAGFETQCFDSARVREDGLASINWFVPSEQLTRWIESLPKPLAVLGATDYHAFGVIDAATRQGLSVPDEISVLGVDNDAPICELSRPTLSSIETGASRIGHMGAELLGRMLDGKDVPLETVRVEGEEVVARSSTDAVHTLDADVSSAMQFIRNNAAAGIDVDAVVRHVSLSRRTLERRFQQYFNRGVQAQILRSRVALAREFLRTSDLSINEVRRRAGFTSEAQLFRIFHRVEGMTPRGYRQQFRFGR